MRASTKLGLFARTLALAVGLSALGGARQPERPEATFIGFNVEQGGAGMVFVQLTDMVTVEGGQTQKSASYLLKGATVSRKNNYNPLPAAAFGSALARAQLVPDKAGVRLVLELTAPVKLSHRMVRKGRGAVLEVEIPAPPRQ